MYIQKWCENDTSR